VRTIGVVTVARSDFGILLPLLRRVEADPETALRLYVTGMHLAPEFGLTVNMIESAGIPVGERIEMLVSSDEPEGVAKSMGLGVLGFAQSFAAVRPDILVVMGDRFDMAAGPLAALPFKIPVAHIHGGEVTIGAIDDALRHSLTKLSHLHFASTEEYARRIAQMGEEEWRITVSGAPGLDSLRAVERLDRDAFAARFGVRLPERFLLVTYHPVTLQFDRAEEQLREFLAALDACGLPALCTLPNADTKGRAMGQTVREFARGRPQMMIVDNLGTEGYFSAMGMATAMVGNSSSGIIEAPSFRLPVVNVGIRQEGRIRAANIVDVGPSTAEILAGIEAATSDAFRESLKDMVSPYGDGHASERILERLKGVPLDDRLVLKRFVDL